MQIFDQEYIRAQALFQDWIALAKATRAALLGIGIDHPREHAVERRIYNQWGDLLNRAEQTTAYLHIEDDPNENGGEEDDTDDDDSDEDTSDHTPDEPSFFV